MKYHDNEVVIALQSLGSLEAMRNSHGAVAVNNDGLAEGLDIVKGSYKVQDFSVTSGQDPDGNIYSGLKVKFGRNGKMSFCVGRKSSDKTAKWFNDRIRADQTTFNHTADKLNFAFIGVLKLTLTGGFLENAEKTFVFKDIVIAQGHTGASNNWWFGGKHGSHTGINQILVNGTAENGPDVEFRFCRGGNAVNAIGVQLSRFADTADWMSWISGETSLNNLVMPGSHDAGMSELHHCCPGSFSNIYSKTQFASIKKQLVDGARYFDIRVDYDYDELVTYHRTGGAGCNGQSLKSILDEASSFLECHSKEFLILKISHIRDYDDHDPSSTKSKIDTLLCDYSDRIYTNNKSNINLVNLKINEARGKMILVFDYDEFISTENGRFRYENNPVSDSNPPCSVASNFLVFDDYSNTSSYEKMSSDQIDKWNTHAGFGQDSMFLLSWTLTPQGIGSGVHSLAMIANPRISEVMHQQINIKGKGKPNIIYVDFLNAELASVAIMYNSELWSK